MEKLVKWKNWLNRKIRLNRKTIKQKNQLNGKNWLNRKIS